MRSHRRRTLREPHTSERRGRLRRDSRRFESGRLDLAPRVSGDRVPTVTRGGADLAAARSAAGPGVLAPGTFLDRLTDAERDGVIAIGRERIFPRGTVLMYQDEPADRIVILLDGRVKVTRVEGDGRESLLSIRDPGDLLGELSFVDGHPRLATVSTVEPVRALLTTAEELQRHLESTPRVAVVLLQTLVSRFRESTLKRTQFANTDTMGRLAARIIELAERYGGGGGRGDRRRKPPDPGGPGSVDRSLPCGRRRGAATPARARLDRRRAQTTARARPRCAASPRRVTSRDAETSARLDQERRSTMYGTTARMKSLSRPGASPAKAASNASSAAPAIPFA